MDDVNNILCRAKDARWAFTELFRLRKRNNPKTSMTWIGRKAGIKSKGYVADIISGRRRIGLRYAKALGKALGLNAYQSRLFCLLVDLDHLSTDSERTTVVSKIDLMRKSLSVKLDSAPVSLPLDATVFRVFCAFGILGNRVSRLRLEKLFPRVDPKKIHRALDHLEAAGYIRLRKGLYELAVREVRIASESNEEEQIRFVTDSIEFAKDEVSRWFPQRNRAFFDSSLVSVSTREFVRRLPDIKASLTEIQSSIESPDADGIVSFNCQIFPIEAVK